MPQSILPFLLACIVVELTPGPNMTYVVALSSMRGRKAGVSLVAGIAVGLLTIGLIAASGAATFVAENSVLYHSLRWAGTLYMVWLAWDSWREDTRASEIVESFDIRYFRRGFITNVLNPKAALFYITVFPSFIDSERAALSQWIGMVLVYVCVATIVHMTLVILGDTIRPLLEDRRNARNLRRFFSILLLGIAVWFAWSTRVPL